MEERTRTSARGVDKGSRSAPHVTGGLLVTLIGAFGFLASIAIGPSLALGLISIFGALLGTPWLAYGVWLLARNADDMAGRA